MGLKKATLDGGCTNELQRKIGHQIHVSMKISQCPTKKDGNQVKSPNSAKSKGAGEEMKQIRNVNVYLQGRKQFMKCD